jgi:hypothetical protein
MNLLADIQSSEGATEARKKKAQEELEKELGEDALDPTSWSDEQKEKYVKEYYSKLYDISESDI